jgi:hypothetical protein
MKTANSSHNARALQSRFEALSPPLKTCQVLTPPLIPLVKRVETFDGLPARKNAE